MGHDAGALVKFEGRYEEVGGFLGGDRTLIAITERVAERGTVGGEADIVDAPTVDGDGGYAFRSGCGGFAEAFCQACKDGGEGPMKRWAAMDGTVGDAMDDLAGWLVAGPAEKGNATTLGT
jgi:hypothetical protein